MILPSFSLANGQRPEILCPSLPSMLFPSTQWPKSIALLPPLLAKPWLTPRSRKRRGRLRSFSISFSLVSPDPPLHTLLTEKQERSPAAPFTLLRRLVKPGDDLPRCYQSTHDLRD
ncbi:unnamed protein product [Lactuca saligna]|uniref:Uncharacterized protein n=1 Tax=Lactuca saligna TaxID=75948 RepID=A0AA35YQ42_LACSI|nr:unnamed protein product [Lactuca saligna]